MNGSIVDVNKFKVIVFDNFYEQHEYDAVLNECLFFAKRNKLKSPEETKSAKKNGVFLKKNSGIFLDEAFTDRNLSDILHHNRKIFNPIVLDSLKKIDPIYNYFDCVNRDATLLNYYENGDYYISHKDDAVITILSWFYKEPKSFFGGDIIFEKTTSNVFVECKNNRVVFFPSFLAHEVTKIEIPENKVGLGYGRFSTTQLLTII